MKLVIDIWEDTYKATCRGSMLPPHVENVVNAIKNGIPLKGHGRLIDADEVDDAIYRRFEDIQCYDGTGYDIYSDAKESINEIPTIIEADKESEDNDKKKLSWLGKNCKDCGNKKCKELGELPKGYDCALWQPESENK